MTDTAQTLIAYCREQERVCPQPPRWNTLWELLPDRRRKGAGWEPALPLILAAWNCTSDLDKIARLEEHILWAEEHGALVRVAEFLRQLPQQDWHHTGE
jgi:hypothetical protein